MKRKNKKAAHGFAVTQRRKATFADTKTDSCHALFSVAAIISLFTFAVYLPALRSAFVAWDDGEYVYNNIHIRSLNWGFLRWALTDLSNLWHPLSWISHALDYAFWGLNPFGHHLTNIVLHAINTGIVVFLTITLLKVVNDRKKASGDRTALSDHALLIAGGLTGLLFGIHPVHVESVAWVTERKDLLYALFYLLGVMSYIRAVHWMGEIENLFLNRQYYWTLLLFFLSLCSKPMAVTFPVVLLLLDWYPLKRITTLRTFLSAFKEKVPFLVLGSIISVVTIIAQKTAGGLWTLGQLPLEVRIPVAFNALVHYLWNVIAPVSLWPLYRYPEPKDVSFTKPEYLAAIILIFLITSICVILAKRNRLWLTAWGYFVIAVFPVLGFFQAGVQSMADRFMYLPSLGLFIPAGLGLAGVWTKAEALQEKGRILRQFAITAVIALTIALSFMTVKQIAVWRDAISLWNTLIQQEPARPDLYYLRGAGFKLKDETERALEDYTRAINLAPDYVAAYVNRGVLFLEKDQIEPAIEDFKRALTLDQGALDAYVNLGNAYHKKKEDDRALEAYDSALARDPKLYTAYINRGVIYNSNGQTDKAIADFTQALSLRPDQDAVYVTRGNLYLKKGFVRLAVGDYQSACNLGNTRGCEKALFPFQ